MPGLKTWVSDAWAATSPSESNELSPNAHRPNKANQ